MGYDFTGFLLEFFNDTNSHLKHAALSEAHYDMSDSLPALYADSNWPRGKQRVMLSINGTSSLLVGST